jgi:hypothetical protein
MSYETNMMHSLFCTGRSSWDIVLVIRVVIRLIWELAARAIAIKDYHGYHTVDLRIKSAGSFRAGL